ncbi:MAG: DHH family phosphoesterase [Candidatus Liptonbacteria bacterium]|nr:DHH family phosphoesterase [Candidatus Liptonbacteria bacterium]
MLLVTSYLNPDLDGTACSIAYAELLQAQGRGAQAALFGTPSEEARWVLKEFNITLPEPAQMDQAEVILVDASDLNWLATGLDPKQVIEIIDHRPVHEAQSFPNAKVQIELVGSCATLVAEKFQAAGQAPSRNVAYLLQAAIISNTLNFQSGTTTERDWKAAVWLAPLAELPGDFAVQMFRAKSNLMGPKLVERIANEYATFTFGGHKILFAQIEMLGASELAIGRTGEILVELQRLKQDLDQDVSFLSIIELAPDHSSTVFITDEPETQELLSRALGVKFFRAPDPTPVGTVRDFAHAVGLRPGLLMRKEAVKILKDRLAPECNDQESTPSRSPLEKGENDTLAVP